jgi:hypothetical protein
MSFNSITVLDADIDGRWCPEVVEHHLPPGCRRIRDQPASLVYRPVEASAAVSPVIGGNQPPSSRPEIECQSAFKYCRPNDILAEREGPSTIFSTAWPACTGRRLGSPVCNTFRRTIADTWGVTDTSFPTKLDQADIVFHALQYIGGAAFAGSGRSKRIVVGRLRVFLAAGVVEP